MKQVHVDCLKRLCKMSGCYAEIVQFLLDEKIIDQPTLIQLGMEYDKETSLCEILFKSSKQEKIQLLDFEWSILPVERIRLKIVTDMSTVEYTHNY